MNDRLEDVLRRYAVWEPIDKHGYQRKLRLLQSHWRTRKGLPMKSDGDKARGAELPIPEAKETLVNYLTPTIREVVRREVKGPKSRGKSFQPPRIYNHLLSSQPLCFNLFGELAEDLDLASQVLNDMSKGRVSRVTTIEFEWSPGRDNPRYTDDKSAFDVYVTYQNATGLRGFLGIEVKYHENLEEKGENYYRPHYDEVAAAMGCFHEEHLDRLRQVGCRRVDGLQQMWRDHLLMGAHRQEDGFADACSVFLYPAVNTTCETAVAAYRQCLSDDRTFEAWTIESFVSCLRQRTDAEWVQLFYDRYLDLSRLPL